MFTRLKYGRGAGIHQIVAGHPPEPAFQVKVVDAEVNVLPGVGLVIAAAATLAILASV